MYQFYNPNPQHLRVGDCVVRALCLVTGKEWEDIYINLCLLGLIESDLPSANSVWGLYLKNDGWSRHIASEPTVEDFSNIHRDGTYIVALNGHVVAVKNGTYFDAWDSGNESIIYYWSKE